MSKSGGSIISLPTIIALIVAYNFLFDDDEDKKDTSNKDTNEVTISEKAKDEAKEVKEKLMFLYEQAKKQYDEATTDEKKAEIKRGLDNLRAKLGIKEEEKQEPKIEAPPKKEETPKPLTPNKEETYGGMRKL